MEPAELRLLNDEKLASNLGGVAIPGGDKEGGLLDRGIPIGGRNPGNDSGVEEGIPPSKPD
eukprot:1680853-Alexandrium_andersonii.AAC.1